MVKGAFSFANPSFIVCEPNWSTNALLPLSSSLFMYSLFACKFLMVFCIASLLSDIFNYYYSLFIIFQKDLFIYRVYILWRDSYQIIICFLLNLWWLGKKLISNWKNWQLFFSFTDSFASFHIEKQFPCESLRIHFFFCLISDHYNTVPGQGFSSCWFHFNLFTVSRSNPFPYWWFELPAWKIVVTILFVEEVNRSDHADMKTENIKEQA